MSTTTTLLFPAPPPTSNALPTHQRTRLLRSTRKLGALLGTTPLLLDPAPAPAPSPVRLPIGPAHGKSHSLEAHRPSPASSTESLPLTRDGRPRPLLLRLNAVPLSPSDARCPLTPSPSRASYPPSSPSYARSQKQPVGWAFPPTPRTPAFDAPVPDARRRKMAKLARTLGENVPPELVFPPPWSTSTATSPVAASYSQAATAEPRRTKHRRSLSLSTVRPLPPLPPQQHLFPSPPPRKSSLAFASPEHALLAIGAPGPRQPSWIGEWNVTDMREVQRALRGLKGR